MAVQVQISGSIAVSTGFSSDANLVKQLAAAMVNGTSPLVGEVTLGGGSQSITLPASPAQLAYIKNNHVSNTVTVTWTPLGGSSVVVQTLEPGGLIFYCQPGTGAGITALSLNASAGTPVEYILAG